VSLAALRPRTHFGRYQILASVGHGGMSDVSLALARGRDGADKVLVIKQLRRGLAHKAEIVSMFLDEGRLAVRLNHPNVVQTYEVGHDGDEPFIAMEYLDGQPLNRIIRRIRDRGGLPLSAHLQILVELLSGLEYAHKLCDYEGQPLQVVHRDVSPQNVFVTYAGQTKVIDFGIAKVSDAHTQTQAGSLKGKLAYMSPEQSRCDEVDARADLFSVGVMLWEALEGRRLWQAYSDPEIASRLVKGQLPDLEELPEDTPELLRQICRRALMIDVDDRFASAGEFRAALDTVIDALDRRSSRRALGELLSEAFAEDREADQALVRRRVGELGHPPFNARTSPFVGSVHDTPDTLIDTTVYESLVREVGPEEQTVDYGPSAIRGRRRRSLRLLGLAAGLAACVGGGLAVARQWGNSVHKDGVAVAGASELRAATLVRGSSSSTSGSPGGTSTRPGALRSSTSACAPFDTKQRVALELGAFEEDAVLTCDKQYLLKYKTFIPAGVTLTIEPGTVIRGDTDTLGTLIVQPGGRLVAEGTAELPIVFTSAQPEHSAEPGDWGGLILLGRAPLNLRTAAGAPKRGQVEGLTASGEYGGDDPEDDSGVLRYLRIEYAGVTIAPGNEINGLTLAGVGRGTQIDHVQIRHAKDDCFEFFGGTVDVHHLICEDPGDDAFDADYGYSGRQQFLLAVGGRAGWKGNGFELDNDPEGSLHSPRTHVRAYNLTLCGSRPHPGRQTRGAGILARRSARIELFNSVISGFGRGLERQGEQTEIEDGGLTLIGNGDQRPRSAGSEAWGSDFGCAGATPKYKPAVALFDDVDPPPDDGFFQPVAYVGAFESEEDRWDEGWTAWSSSTATP